MLRVAVGGFFAIAGYHKITVKERHAALVQTLKDNHIPWVRFNEWWVPSVEVGAGLSLCAGFMTPVAASLLGAICLVATCTDGWRKVQQEYKPINKADLIDDLLYLPEVLYGLKLLAIMIVGPGLYSLDAIIFNL
jgi:putative oxidoreductase